LQRRLAERNSVIQIEKRGRGRFRLALDCRLALEDVEGGALGPPAA
jgi:hypothetical protein